MTHQQLLPLHGRIFVTPDDRKQVTESGILISGRERDMQDWFSGTIAATGPDVKGLQIGDTVIYQRFSFYEIEVDGTVFHMIPKYQDVQLKSDQPAPNIHALA